MYLWMEAARSSANIVYNQLDMNINATHNPTPMKERILWCEVEGGGGGAVEFSHRNRRKYGEEKTIYISNCNLSSFSAVTMLKSV